MSEVVSDIITDLRSNPKALLWALGVALGWGVVVKLWKSSLEKRMGFVGDSELQEEYDFIIVGAGNAGCLLASRLSEDPNTSVLLLEAGRPALGELGVASPALWTSLWHSMAEWALETTPQAALGDRALHLHRARLLGGNGTNDNLVYGRGNAQDYSRWVEEHGASKEWYYEELIPFFQKSESYSATTVDCTQRGTRGEVTVEDLKNGSAMGRTFVQACQEQGIPECVEDYGAPRMHGASTGQYFTQNGLRVDAAGSFLLPIFQSRKNLTIKGNSFVGKVLVEDGEAQGVQYWSMYDGGIVRARKEVIICGGPIGSPALLMHSGIGPKEHLEEFSIPCVADLPSVGSHLQDQLIVPLPFRPKYRMESLDSVLFAAGKFIRAFIDYYIFSRGSLYRPFIEAVAYESTEEEPLPSIQQLAASRNLRECYVPFNEDAAPVEPVAGMTVASVLLHPRSQGTVRLQSSDPFQGPIINPNYFEDAEDKAELVRGVQRAYEISRSAAMSTVLDELVVSSPMDPSQEKDAVFWEQFVTQEAQSTSHIVGTCRMGIDASTAVVDDKLRVFGVQKLRVMDSSVIPDHVSHSNSRAVSLVIAEKGAVLLKESHQAC